MDAHRREAGAGHQALETVLGAYFGAQRIEAEGRRYRHASAMPSVVLWIHAWHPLPDLVAWLAVLGWGMCLALAVALGAAAISRRARVQAMVPEARRVVRLQFAPERGAPAASALLFHLALAASAALWLHALAPHALRPAAVAIAAKSWALLIAAALANKYFERA